MFTTTSSLVIRKSHQVTVIVATGKRGRLDFKFQPTVQFRNHHVGKKNGQGYRKGNLIYTAKAEVQTRLCNPRKVKVKGAEILDMMKNETHVLLIQFKNNQG